MRKTRSILILSPWPAMLSMRGGGTPIATDLVQTLIQAGYSVDFVAPEAGGAEDLPFDARIRVHRHRPPLEAKRYLTRWVAALDRTLLLSRQALGAVRQQGKPDAIYAFSALTVPAAIVVGRLLRRPTIGYLFGTFLYPHLRDRRGRLDRFEEVIAFKSPVDRLVILNDGTRGDDVARALGVPAQRLRFWMHGLDLEACSAAATSADRAELGLPAVVPVVVSTSRLARWKHVERILRAAPAVLAERPDTLFAISGDGPERAALESLAKELSIAHAVRFLGPLPRDANLRLIAAADVFCALYDYSCVGVALLEALGCGVSVVVADTGATRDFVEDGVNGLVVPPRDTALTAAAISRLVQDADLRARLGREARSRAEERFLTPEQRARLELETLAEVS